jgi:hypothetical protein
VTRFAKVALGKRNKKWHFLLTSEKTLTIIKTIFACLI